MPAHVSPLVCLCLPTLGWSSRSALAKKVTETLDASAIRDQLCVRDAVAVFGCDLADHSYAAGAHWVDAVDGVAHGAFGERVLAEGAALFGKASDGPIMFFEPKADDVAVESWHVVSWLSR